MIVCSCNVLSDHALRSAIAGADKRPRVSQVYACLGCKARCGRCAGSIRRIMDEATDCRTDSRNACEGAAGRP